MEHSKLLSNFQKKVDEFEKYQGYIEKAQGQADRFETSVIEKVVSSNTEKAMKVVDELIPMMAEVEEHIGSLKSEKEGLLVDQSESRDQLNELELRHVIGEMTKKQFESGSKDLKALLDKVDASVAEFDEKVEALQTELTRWNEAAAKAGVLSGQTVEVEDSPDGIHSETVSVQEDVSDVFDEDDAEIIEVSDDVDEIIEVSDDVDEVIEVSDDVDEVIEIGDDDGLIEAAESDDGDLDILVDDDDGLELEPEEIEAEQVNGSERRAVLLYQEGTAEEQVHPIANEVISLGRGRDNDIQVKNDSKVSRYHCKIYSRGPNYYIEDNKSANGSLVNGELITERRLFGGEEVIIGETFFRFRILD
jgi:hypothetical protein